MQMRRVDAAPRLTGSSASVARHPAHHRVVAAAIYTMLSALLALQASAQTPEPPWRTRLMPWGTHAGQPRPWRNDSRLRGQAAPGYPDDYRVLFLNPDSARGGQHEV